MNKAKIKTNSDKTLIKFYNNWLKTNQKRNHELLKSEENLIRGGHFIFF